MRRLQFFPHTGAIKPEVTQGMIEINSSVHMDHASLLAELSTQREILIKLTNEMNVRVTGGGTHPFHKWSRGRIYPAERFKNIFEQYGYLAKLFTIFGQHIHIGCRDGDEAIYLVHALARYIPHFIALSASSPFYQGGDTSFDSSRLSIVNAFPLSGVMPYVDTWEGFEAYFEKMYNLKVVESMKDFYWDIRPKPEYGTVEIRVCDTPLSVEKGAAIGIYAQVLSAYLLSERPLQINPDLYLLYSYNRFQACRYGLNGIFTNPFNHTHRTVTQDILDTLKIIEPYADAFSAAQAIAYIKGVAETGQSDAVWLRSLLAQGASLVDVVRMQSDLWAGKIKPSVN